MKATKKQITIDFYTFEEFIEIGRNTEGVGIGPDGLPWSFNFKGHPITNENATCYLIPTMEGTMQFTPNDVLIVGVKGEIYPCKKDIFEMSYDVTPVLGETFESRLRKEYNELVEKAGKLKSFTERPDFRGIVGETQADLLLLQFKLMNEYATILAVRMVDLKMEI